MAPGGSSPRPAATAWCFPSDPRGVLLPEDLIRGPGCTLIAPRPRNDVRAVLRFTVTMAGGQVAERRDPRMRNGVIATAAVLGLTAGVTGPAIASTGHAGMPDQPLTRAASGPARESVTLIDTHTNTRGATVPVGKLATQIALTPAGTTYITRLCFCRKHAGGAVAPAPEPALSRAGRLPGTVGRDRRRVRSSLRRIWLLTFLHRARRPGLPGQRSSRMVALAWPPPSHMVCRP
jgi:hypothetical protein